MEPKNPLVLDVHSLSRAFGASRELRREIPAPAEFGTPLVGVPEGAVIHLQVRLEAVVEGVLVTARAEAPLAGECGRCLDEFTDTARVRFQELYAYPERVRDLHLSPDEARDVAADDTGTMTADDLIDLEPALRDAVVLSLPINPLCEPDCPGLDLHGVRRETAVDEPGDVDERWAALRSFTPAAPDR